MVSVKFITDEVLNKFTDEKALADRARALLKQQVESWDLANGGFSSLETVETKDFEFDGFTIKVQFNPGRIRSSAAKVDKKSIQERKCFLCYNHLPEAQKGIPFDDYLILVNPFPIFPEHFTIPKVDHVLQLIDGNLEGMLDLAKEIGKYYTLFYNGPKCGASAPDHMHYQAGLKGFMPIDTEFEEIVASRGEKLFEDNDTDVYGVENYLRKFFSIESSDREKVLSIFKKLYSVMDDLKGEEVEPMMNILAGYENGRYRIIVFPRGKHRPSQFFEEGEKQILLSPASVDLGGVCITPREEDFNKITKEDLIDIFRQISISTEQYEFFKKEFVQKLK